MFKSFSANAVGHFFSLAKCEVKKSIRANESAMLLLKRPPNNSAPLQTEEGAEGVMPELRNTGNGTRVSPPARDHEAFALCP